jgi:alpha-1,2-mannosyltransferase
VTESPGATSSPPGRRWWLGVALIAASIAFAARLVPVLRGGGLVGLGNYDDGVYYVAGTAMSHGLLPYRDFLFLHPPGVVLATVPFGLVGRVLGDPVGLAAARLTWMLLGAVNTVLVARIVRPLGLLPAALGALTYAFSYAAIYTEWTTLLVAPAQTCVLAAVLLLAARPAQPRVALILTLGAGALLGASATFKIWGVAAVAAVAVWLLMSGSWRRTLTLLTGSALAITVICLPFFLAAPAAMWRMVVLYQLGRDASGVPLATRLAGIVGMGLDQPRVQTFTPVLIAVLVLVLGLLVVAGLVREARVSLALTVVLIAVLLLSPSWFLHYPGLVTGPLAVALACGAAKVITWAGVRRRIFGVVVAVLLALPVLAQAYRQRNLELGLTFPGFGMAQAVAATRGCVTSDDPASLAAMNTLTRNLRRGCPFIADFSGYSYRLAYERGRWVSRSRDPAWQEMYVGYLRTGTAGMSWRYRRADALSPTTIQTIADWPRIRRIDRFTLREPR